MTKAEARAKAIDLFGPSGGVSEGLQMKESLERAVGVGFREGPDLCIQGKGITWEEAFAHAETRREKWEDRVVVLPGDPVTQFDSRERLPGWEVGEPQPIHVSGTINLDEFSESQELLERVREKVQKKWGQ